MRVQARTPGLGGASCGELLPFTCGTAWLHERASELAQPLGSIGPGSHRLVFDVVVERGWRPGGASPPPTTSGATTAGGPILWQGTVELDLEVVATVDDALPPVSSASLDRAVADSVSATLRERPDATVLALRIDDTRAELAGVALATQARLLRHGLPVGPSRPLVVNRLPLTLGPWSGFDAAGWANWVVEGDERPSEASCAGWSVRLTGTDRDVERLWHADRRWAGTVEVPLSTLVGRAASRADR